MENICLYRYRNQELEAYYTARGLKICIFEEKTQQFFSNNTVFLSAAHSIDDIKQLLSNKGVNKADIVTVAGEIYPELCMSAIENGLTKIITEENLLLRPEVLCNFRKDTQLTSDRVVLFDSGDKPVEMISDLLEVYNISCRKIESYSRLLDIMAKEKDIVVLLNLGGNDFEMTRFVKDAQILPDVKQIPVIPFKNTKLGVGTADVSCGLNKIAKVILSNHEILSLLSVLLVKKDFHSSVYSSLQKLELDDFFSRNTLRQIYFQKDSGFFSLDHPYPQRNFSEIFGQMKNIESVFNRMMMFEWMTSLA